jgi:hypothetical protein
MGRNHRDHCEFSQHAALPSDAAVSMASSYATAITPETDTRVFTQLERLARTVRSENTPAEIAVELAEIESATPRYSFRLFLYVISSG